MSLSVGVVVPTYNGGRYLRECIDSILAQDYENVTCLVRDGGSTDNSVEILESYGDAIRYISEKDRGQSDAIDKGFKELDTDLVGWLNGDDVFYPNTVSRVVEVAEQNEDAVLIHGDVERIDIDSNSIGQTISIDIDYDIMRRARGRTVQPGSFYRKWAIEACGGVDESFYMVMDVDLWIRLLKHGRAVRIDGNLARYRVHPDAKTSQSMLRHYREMFRIGFRHERDRLARATLRRGYFVLRHFAISNVRQGLRRVGLST